MIKYAIKYGTTLRLTERNGRNHLFSLENNVLHCVVDRQHSLHNRTVDQLKSDLAVHQPAGLHVLEGADGAHHHEVGLGQVFVEREAVAPRSLLGGGRDPCGILLLVLKANRSELMVVKPGYYRLVLTLLSRQDVGLLNQLVSGQDSVNGTPLIDVLY